ncbi:uncharacterized protein isoform X3 [Rhodnius prolixus]|uniref:uncharacterized protein isoform X3 n=1 Tax=Rhodnius prolixus TaxID=13249 RepID=UPI003D188F8F
MACNCPTIKSIPESDKRKRSRTIPRIDANLILNLSSLITTENESERYKKFWVDFSVRSGNIQLYCSAGTGQWGKVSIDFSNVNGISCVEENKNCYKLKSTYISGPFGRRSSCIGAFGDHRGDSKHKIKVF